MTIERLAAALVDRYRIERELGQGGMATVYLAEDLKHDRKVALRVLRPELAAVLGAERFVQEIKTTAQLQHPHILPLFDSGTADGFLYFVDDIYMMARGYELTVYVIWIAIHTAVIVTGLYSLRGPRPARMMGVAAASS